MWVVKAVGAVGKDGEDGHGTHERGWRSCGVGLDPQHSPSLGVKGDPDCTHMCLLPGVRQAPRNPLLSATVQAASDPEGVLPADLPKGRGRQSLIKPFWV